MSHSGDFARWPHLGPIRPMARGGHLGPLSYVYGYRGGIGRRSSVEMTPATKLGHQSGDMSSLYGAAWPFLCPNRPFPRWADVGQRKNGRSVEKNLSAVRFLWAILGGVQSGWEQFGAVKKWAGVIASRRVQLNALSYSNRGGVARGTRPEDIRPRTYEHHAYSSAAFTPQI